MTDCNNNHKTCQASDKSILLFWTFLLVICFYIQLTQRKVIKESKSLGIYSCDICGHQVEHNVSLNQHKKSVHQGVTYSCNQCNLVSRSRANLEEQKRDSNTIATNVKEILMHTKRHSVMESNIIALTVAIKQLWWEIWIKQQI